jgi:hypothetical protein
MIYIVYFLDKPFKAFLTETDALAYIDADPRPNDYHYVPVPVHKS